MHIADGFHPFFFVGVERDAHKSQTATFIVGIDFFDVWNLLPARPAAGGQKYAFKDDTWVKETAVITPDNWMEWVV